MRQLLPITLTLAAFLTGCAKQAPKPNVLLIVVDTWRADRLGRGDLTPNLDAFAKECLVFDHAQSPRAKTTPAVTSLMTGLYPHDHGVRDLTTPLAPDVPVIAEAFKANGYRTAAIVGNYVLQRELSGLARGFDLWIEDLPELSGTMPEGVPLRRAKSITDGGLCALGLGQPATDGAGPQEAFTRNNLPWFMWLHYMDPHGMYSPPEPYRSLALKASSKQGGIERIPAATSPARTAISPQWVADYNVPDSARLTDGGIDARHVRALYDGEVRSVDAQIGRLLDKLRASGALANTLVIITSDHGESLGEHDYWFEHGRHAYEATCRVPLMIHFPETFAARPKPGLRTGDISLADIFPTLGDILLPRIRQAPGQRESVRGKSRAALMMESRAQAGAVFCEKVERAEKANAIQAKAARIGDWKLIRRYSHLADSSNPTDRKLIVLSEELFDLKSDPDEAINLIQDPPANAPLEELATELLRFSKSDQHFSDLARLLQQKREELGRTDPETLRALKALGY
ncbi:MAG: arylsulfatase A-like enzyme [Planctomycetota bacterium]